jgi:hypothetical protein
MMYSADAVVSDIEAISLYIYFLRFEATRIRTLAQDQRLIFTLIKWLKIVVLHSAKLLFLLMNFVSTSIFLGGRGYRNI